MYRRAITFSFILFILFISGFAQTFTGIPAWVKIENIPVTESIDSKNVKEGYYYVLLDEQYNTVLKHDYFHYATKVVSNVGLEHVSQIEISYDPLFQKVQIHYIRIYRGKDVIDRTHTSGVKLLKEEANRSQGILNENNTLYANLSDVQQGDIVEYAYSKIGGNKIFNNYFSYNFWFGYSVPVGRVSRCVLVDKDTKLSITNKNCEIKPEILRGKYITYNWVVNNGAILNMEDNTPSWYDPYPLIEVSNCKDWKEVKIWSRSLFSIKEYENKKLSILIDSIKNKYSNIEDQITSLIDFTQNQIRYLATTGGIYSHQPHLPDFVLDNRYGDCKDKSLFLIELLKGISIQSFPVLLNTEKKRTIQYENPSVGEFDHCIVAINYQDRLYYIDPTISCQGGDFKNRKLPDYEMVFTLDEKENLFTHIPSDSTSKITVTEDFKINHETKDAILKVRSIYTGMQADILRYTFTSNSLSDMQENYRSFYLKYSDEVVVTDTLTINDNVQANKIETSENYLLKHFWERTDSNSTKILKDMVPFVLNERVLYTSDNIRKQPLKISYPAHIVQNINIFNTKGWDIKDNTIENDNAFFYYQYKTTVNDKLLSLNYVYRSKVSEVEAVDYAQYKVKTDFVDKNMVLSLSASDVNDSVFGFNWLLIVISVASILFSLILSFNLYKLSFSSEFENRYDSIGGWLVLVGIGIIITPAILSYKVIKLYYDEINIDYFYYYFNETSQFYHPLKGYYEIFINFGNIFFIISSIFLIALFFQRKRSFRYYYCYYRIINVVFLIIDLLLVYAFVDNTNNPESRVLINTQAGALGKLVLQACIWIPYVWYSERSRHTFTVDTNDNISIPQ